MKKGNAIASIGLIHEKANRSIVREPESHGIEGIVPSHGGILVYLFDHGAAAEDDELLKRSHVCSRLEVHLIPAA